MDKNLLLAVILSSAILIGYNFLFPPAQPKEGTQNVQKQVEESSTSIPNSTTQPAELFSKNNIKTSVPTDENSVQKGKIVSIKTPLYTAYINTQNAYFSDFYLSKYSRFNRQEIPLYSYPIAWFQGKKPELKIRNLTERVNMIDRQSDPSGFMFDVQVGDNQETIFYSGSDKESVSIAEQPYSLTLQGKTASGIQIFKTFTFSPHNYILEANIRLVNTSDRSQTLLPQIDGGTGPSLIEQSHTSSAKEGVALVNNGFETYDDFEEDIRVEEYRWIGIMDTYFISSFLTEEKNWSATYSLSKSFSENKQIIIPKLSLQGATLTLAPQQVSEYKFKIYMGPKEFAEMEKYDSTFPEGLDLTLNLVARPMLHGLRYFHELTGNWGIAIIMLTILVRIMMFPLAYKGMKSMKRMSRLTPRIKHLKDKYGKNKEKLNKEMMLLYKRNKINPVGGCLPLLFQIPIFIALYWALLPAIELRHQPFALWIYDLSQADHTLILPLLMGVSMFVQQRITPMPATVEPMQQKIMQLFPILMTFFFITFPSGLVLYWVTSNIITVLQQLIFNQAAIKEVVD